VNKKVDGQRKRKPEKKHKGDHKKEDTKGGEEAKVRILYKNVAGLSKKRDEFWDYVRQFDIVGLVETWVEERSWKKIGKSLPKEYKWVGQGT
jgi:hypothetical protein